MQTITQPGSSGFQSQTPPGIYVFRIQRGGWTWYGEDLPQGGHLELDHTNADKLARAHAMADAGTLVYEGMRPLEGGDVVSETVPAPPAAEAPSETEEADA